MTVMGGMIKLLLLVIVTQVLKLFLTVVDRSDSLFKDWLVEFLLIYGLDG